jgi:glycosyltransferase involved in cell wall biosynthesis
MKVSIIIPTYNRAALLPRAVRSVLAQDYRPLELVIVNDGSTDHTGDAITGMEAEIRGAGVELQVVHQANAGLAEARNAGTRAATGDFFGYLDDDDTFYPHKTRVQAAKLKETGADACCAYLLKMLPGGNQRHPGPKKRLLTGLDPAAYVRGTAYAHLNSMLIAQRLWPEVGDFDPELRISQDVEWCARLAHVATFCAVEEELGTWEFTPDAVSRVNSLDGLIRRDGFLEQVLLKMRERNRGRANWDDEAWRERAARDFDQMVKHLLYAGRVKDARERWRIAHGQVGAHPVLARTRRTVRKAGVLALIGRRMRHPKFDSPDDVRM